MGKRQRSNKSHTKRSKATVITTKGNNTEKDKVDDSKQQLSSFLISFFAETALTLFNITVLPEEMKQIRLLVWVIYVFLVGIIVFYYFFVSKRLNKNRKLKKKILALYWLGAVLIVIFTLLLGANKIQTENRESDYEPIEVSIEYKEAVEINNKQEGTTKTILGSNGSLIPQSSYESVKVAHINAMYGSIATVSGDYKTIYAYAFDGEKNKAYSSIDHVVLSEGVEIIEGKAFYKCPNLQSILLPRSIISIADEAFIGCDKLTLIVYENSYAYDYCKENNLKYELENP